MPTATGRLGLNPRWAVAALVVGLVLGVAIGTGLSAPLFGSSGSYFLVGALASLIAMILVLSLALAALLRGSRGPLIALAALIAGSVIGYAVAPPAPGALIRKTGTGTAGTAENPAAYWAGTLHCQWSNGDSTVREVAGFRVVLTAALVAELGLESWEISQQLLAITLPPGLAGQAGVGIGTAIDEYTGRGNALLLRDVTATGTAGTAVSPTSLLVLTWACDAGP